MTSRTEEPAHWYRISDLDECRLVWAVPDMPHPGWVACFKSKQDAETGRCAKALLMRQSEFDRCMIARVDLSDETAAEGRSGAAAPAEPCETIS